MTIYENAAADLRIVFATYKALSGDSVEKIAEDLDCSVDTVRNISQGNLKVSSKYTEQLRWRLRLAERRRYE